MRESELLRYIFERSQGLGGHVRVGPGDDCAVVSVGEGPDGSDLLITVDHLIEGRHYASGTNADAVARKSIARSVSDIAAMAGSPRWALATAALPENFPQAKANELFERTAYWAKRFGCPLVGGDIAATKEGTPVTLTVTVGGAPHSRRGAVLRSGARVGDNVYVTGQIGGSLKSGRHLTFEPRVREAGWLADTLDSDLHAMIDLSDGLGRDGARIGEMSGVKIEILPEMVPLSTGVSSAMTAAGDGEDYELLFCVAPGMTIPAICPATGTTLTRIGRVVRGHGCVLVEEGGREVDASKLGWDHAPEK